MIIRKDYETTTMAVARVAQEASVLHIGTSAEREAFLFELVGALANEVDRVERELENLREQLLG